MREPHPDTTTQRALVECFPTKARTSCYIRPDFLANFIALTPRYGETLRVFDRMFPTLLGISVTHHVPDDAAREVHKQMLDHRERTPGRRAAILRDLAYQLKAEGALSRDDVRSAFSRGFEDEHPP